MKGNDDRRRPTADRSQVKIETGNVLLVFQKARLPARRAYSPEGGEVLATRTSGKPGFDKLDDKVFIDTGWTLIAPEGRVSRPGLRYGTY